MLPSRRNANEKLAFPELSWEAICRSGVLELNIPSERGSPDSDPVALLDVREQLASACLTTSLILSQRDAAVRRIADSENEALRGELLLPLPGMSGSRRWGYRS